MKYLLLVISMLFISCGGGSSSSSDSANTNSEQILQGVLYDSVVVGARYKTPTIEGVTNSDGIFKYHKGEKVEFFINSISLGKATPKDVPDSLKDKVKANKIVTPLDLAKNDNNKTVKIAQLLISLDSDGNASNGIDIDSSKLNDKEKNITIDNIDLDNSLEIKVSTDRAKEHLCQSMGFGCEGVEDNGSGNSGNNLSNRNGENGGSNENNLSNENNGNSGNNENNLSNENTGNTGNNLSNRNGENGGSNENNLSNENNGNSGNSSANNSNNQNTIDTIKPIITLNGNPTVTLIVGSSYSDAGVVATDNRDGNISNKITTTGSVDTSRVGTYTITYHVKDLAGNEATATREVIVKEKPNTAPTIEGTPQKRVDVYGVYRFLPTAKDSDGDTLTFSIQNKPSWVEFNTTTGVLEGVPTSEGNYSNIIISVSDGSNSASLAPFAVTVNPAVDIAHEFGKATQPPKNGYYWYYEPSLAIDGNLSTFNHTQGDSTLNWWQLELPSGTKIKKIVIHNRPSNSARLNGAEVYVSDMNYTGVLPTNSIATLNSDLTQTINLSTTVVGKYILVKASGDNNLHMSEVEVYGTIVKTRPFITNSELNTTIGRYRDKVTPIMTIEGRDYQGNLLSYSIVQNSVPFRIDNNGNIYVNGLLPQDSYSFDVNISDGMESITKTIRINIVDKMEVETYYTKSTQPALSGYLPNSYKSGDTITVTIDGKDYTTTIDESSGTWSIPQGDISPRLDIGDYNITLSINTDRPIAYENYFSILGENTHSKQFDMSISNTITDIQVAVSSSTSAPLPKGKVVRATDQNLTKEGGDTILYNDSYRTIHSLIATYTDNSNQKHFLRLIFDKDIEPYSRNVIDFANENNATIFHTAGQYNNQISFGGVDCTQATNDTTIYCTPTTRDDTIYSDRAVQNPILSEQQVFTRVASTWNHLYNRLDGIKSIDAYIHKTSYKDMDYSDKYQGSDSYATGATKDSFFYKRFFATFSPNNHTEYRAMRYKYAAEGMAGLPNHFSTTGERNIGSWASLWEGSIRLVDDNGNFKASPYEYIEHETEHSHGMNHGSGLTYGWPNQARKQFIKKYYTDAKIPSVKAPKYIFDTKVLDKNHIELTLYKTNDATSSNLTFEIFAGNMWRSEDVSFEQLSQNSVKITLSDTVFPRFFIRVYGDDSDEFMSKFITPKEMVAETQSKVGSFNQNSYYLFSRAVWEAYSKFSSYRVSQSKSDKICKILSNNPDAHTAYRADVDVIDNNLTRDNLDTILQGNDSNRYFAQNVVYGDNSDGGWWRSYIYDFTNNPYTKEGYYNHTTEENGRSPIDNAILQSQDVGLICVDPF